VISGKILGRTEFGNATYIARVAPPFEVTRWAELSSIPVPLETADWMNLTVQHWFDLGSLRENWVPIPNVKKIKGDGDRNAGHKTLEISH